MNNFDWIIFIGYIIGMIGLAVYLGKSQKINLVQLSKLGYVQKKQAIGECDIKAGLQYAQFVPSVS